MPEKVGIIYNHPFPGIFDSLGEGGAVAGVLDAVAAVSGALGELGHEIQVLALNPPLSQIEKSLEHLSVDIVFNLFEGFDDSPESEAEVAYLLEKMGFCFTGSPGRALFLSQDKSLARQVLRQGGIPTPDWQVLPEPLSCHPERSEGSRGGHPSQAPLDFHLSFPCIVKPLKTHASHGLSERSLVEDPGSLARQVDFIHSAYGQAALVEEFLPGREFSALVMGNRHPRVLPMEEIVYGLPPGKPRLLTYSAKWNPEDLYFHGTTVRCPAELSSELKHEVENMAIGSFLALGCRAYARVDMREDKQGYVKVIDVNPNPDIGPGGGAWLQVKAAGLDYAAFISEILSLARDASRVGHLKIRGCTSVRNT